MPATTEIPNLWPVDQIRVDVLSPAAIMRAQASEISRLSQGVLRGEVQTEAIKDNAWIYLDVVAPTAGNVRRRVASVKHAIDGVYPVEILELPGGQDRAASQEEFLVRLRTLLQSPRTISLIQSLLARANEGATNKTVAAATGQGS
jgi:hypothetical protein